MTYFTWSAYVLEMRARQSMTTYSNYSCTCISEDGPPTHKRVSGSLLALLAYAYLGECGLANKLSRKKLFNRSSHGQTSWSSTCCGTPATGSSCVRRAGGSSSARTSWRSTWSACTALTGRSRNRSGHTRMAPRNLSLGWVEGERD